MIKEHKGIFNWNPFLLLIMIVLISFTIKAQDQGSNEKSVRCYRHEISVSVGGNNVRSGWSDDYVQSVMDDFGLNIWQRELFYAGDYSRETPDLKWQGHPFSLDYYYHLKQGLAIGVLLQGLSVYEDFGRHDDDRYYGEHKLHICDIDGKSFFLMPTVKWSWVNRRWCSFYSKLSLGFHYQRLHLEPLEPEIIPMDKTERYRRSHISCAYVATPFGWEIGRKHIRWFMEFGYSRTLRFKMGLTYRFKEFKKN